MDFKAATDRLGLLGVTHAEIAEALGIAPSTVRAGRLDSTSASFREPPAEWAGALISLARSRGGELVKLAEELEG